MQGLFKSDTLPGKAQEQINAIKILASQGYTIIDLEENIVIEGAPSELYCLPKVLFFMGTTPQILLKESNSISIIPNLIINNICVEL